MKPGLVVYNEGHEPVYLMAQMKADPYGGPGTPETQMIVMPGQGIDLGILNLAPRPSPACKNGHPWSPESTYINATSKQRICKLCRQESQRRRRTQK